MKQHLIRLDRVAGELNIWLFAIAMGLAVLDCTVLTAKCLPPLPIPPTVTEAQGAANAVVHLPSPK